MLGPDLQWGAYKVCMESYGDEVSWVSGSWQTSSDAWYDLEIEWQAANATGANDERLRLWIDGSRAGEQTGLEDDTRWVAEALLWAVGFQVMRLGRAKKKPVEASNLTKKGEAKAGERIEQYVISLAFASPLPERIERG